MASVGVQTTSSSTQNSYWPTPLISGPRSTGISLTDENGVWNDGFLHPIWEKSSGLSPLPSADLSHHTASEIGSTESRATDFHQLEQLVGDFPTINQGENDDDESLLSFEDLLQQSRIVASSRSGGPPDRGESWDTAILISEDEGELLRKDTSDEGVGPRERLHDSSVITTGCGFSGKLTGAAFQAEPDWRDGSSPDCLNGLQPGSVQVYAEQAASESCCRSPFGPACSMVDDARALPPHSPRAVSDHTFSEHVCGNPWPGNSKDAASPCPQLLYSSAAAQLEKSSQPKALLVDVDGWGQLDFLAFVQAKWRAQILPPEDPSQTGCEIWLQGRLVADQTMMPCGLRPPNHRGSSEQISDTEYEVDCIVDKETRYRVRWKGYGPEEDEWLTKGGLSNALAVVDAYERRTVNEGRRRRPGRPGRFGPESMQSVGRRARPSLPASECTETGTGAGEVDQSLWRPGETLKRPRGSEYPDEVPKRKRGRPRKVPLSVTGEVAA